MMFAPALHAKRAAAAILAAALALLSLTACATPKPQVIEREIIVREVVKEVEVVVTATPAPQPTPTPRPTATPKPTPHAATTPAPARAETRNAPAKPTSTPKPSATPTLTVDDFYVIINQGPTSDGEGVVSLYIDPLAIETGDGRENFFRNEDFLINYLLSREVITPAQRNAYYTPVSLERRNHYTNGRMAEFFDEEYVGNIKVPLRPFANAIQKLYTDQKKRGSLHEKDIFKERIFSYFIQYADKDSLDPGTLTSPDDITNPIPSEDEGYVIINGNNVQTVIVDDQGNTTSVDVKVAGIEEVLDYWLSQNKITVEQRNQYGRTGQLELSFKDGADLFDFAYSDGAFHAGIDEEGVSIIRDKLLPLFTGE